MAPSQDDRLSFLFTPDQEKDAGKSDKFSFTGVADHFDDHINKSIRGYAELRDDIVGISRYFVENQTMVVDIGCSQGSLIRRIRNSNDHAPDANYVGIDVNPSFQQHWKDEQNLKFLIEDVRTWDGLKNLSFAISLFTFQFIPERDRLRLMQKIYENLVDGGAFVCSEKIFSKNAKVQDMMDSLYYDFKKKSFSEKEIMDKEQELRHLAKNTTETLLINQLRNIGFRGIQVFWRNFNFIGVLAMKRPTEELEEDQ